MVFRIPTLEASPIPQAVSPNVVADSLDFGGKGQAIGQAGRVVQKVADDYLRDLADAEDGDFVATAVADMAANEDAALMQAQNSARPGAKGFTQAYMSGFDQRLEGKLKAAPSERARKALQERAITLRGGIHRDSLRFEFESGRALRLGNLSANAAKLQNVAMSRPEMYDALAAQLEDTANAYAGEMPAQERAEWLRKSKADLAAARFAGAIDVDPNATKQELMSGAWDDRLDPADKARLLNASDAEIKRREAASEEKERKALAWAALDEKRADRARDEAEADLTNRILTGEAGMDEVLAAGRNRQIRPATQRTLAELASKQDEGRDDWQTIAGLQGMQLEEDPDLADRVLQARAEGRISTSTMRSFLNDTVEKERGGVGARPDVKEARRRVRESLQGREDPIFGVDPDRGEQVARADQFLMERMKADPKADPARLAEEVVRTFKGGAPEPGALPRTRYLAGSLEEPDIEGSIAALEAARASGEIDDLAASVEAAALEQIFDAAARRARSGGKP